MQARPRRLLFAQTTFATALALGGCGGDDESAQPPGRASVAGPPTVPAAQELVLDAIVERLRPVLVTSLTTLGGVLPTAYGIGGYDPIVSIISLAIGWGLALSTLMSLFLVPVLHSLAGDLRRLRLPLPIDNWARR